MSTRTTVVFFLVVVAIASCSQIKKLRSGNVSDIREVASNAAETAGEIQKCEKLREKDKVAISEEYAVGGAIAVNIVGNNGGLMIDTVRRSKKRWLHAYVNRVGRNLGSQSVRPNLEWTFGVLDTDTFNAYSTPGGYVFVSRGLLEQVDNEAQLAGVLAHEIAHVTQKHALKLYAAIKANQCQTALGVKKGAAEVADAVGFNGAVNSPIGFLDLDDLANLDILAKLVDGLVDDLTSKGFAYDDEYEADLLAAELMLNAGYDPAEYRSFLSKLPEGSGWTHPSKDDRRQKLAAWEKNKLGGDDPFSPKPGSSDLRRIPIKNQLRPIK